jgi:superfamily II DNA/RNA helicase
VQNLADNLAKDSIKVTSIHRDQSLAKRQQAIRDFLKGDVQVYTLFFHFHPLFRPPF